jgi:SAM-dependent methyltransferase
MTPLFTAHNIILDNGEQTNSELSNIEKDNWFISARDLLKALLPGPASQYRIADLACLEGGFTVGFARLGYHTVGIEVRDSNIAACRYVRERVNLENLEFIQDDVWNLAKYGEFDAIFCRGLLYHFDAPRAFINLMASVTKKVLICQTHFSNDEPEQIEKYRLSSPAINEEAQGRWYTEFLDQASWEQNRDAARWSSWNNQKSFFPKREYILQWIHDAGFNFVLEQFGPGNIVGAIQQGYYKVHGRGTFIGVKASET